ncbi:MAG: hypothetical protein QOE84_647 [Actinomycetota bacterium]|jgi:hypothetical protein|nr:hypothetical protein [Actinomycetota bacterium]
MAGMATPTTTRPVRAHLLLQADPGTSSALTAYLQGVSGIVEATGTTGPFDAVAEVSVDDEVQLERVLAATKSAPGLARLCLCRCH